MKKWLGLLVILLVLAALGFTLVNYYEYIFSKVVDGHIRRVVRVTEPSTVIGQATAVQMYSFSVAIQQEDGTIFTSSTEDRQWAAATENFCARARFYPYPPWDLDKSGTYHNARLLQLYECK